MNKLTDKENLANIHIKIPKDLLAKARQAAFVATGRTNLSEFIRNLIEAKAKELNKEAV